MIYGLHYFKHYERENVGEHVRKKEPSGRWPEKWRQFSLKLLDREKNRAKLSSMASAESVDKELQKKPERYSIRAASKQS